MRYGESLNRALHEMMRDDKSAYLIGEDITDPYGGAFGVSRGLSTAFPEQVIPMPISEAAITGFGTGMAMSGCKPIVEIMFGDFTTLIMDQLVNHACKFPGVYGTEVPLVIRTPMGGRRGYGPTHSQTLDGLFMSVPGLTIVAPSHLHDPGALLRAAVELNKPVLFIENKLLYGMELDKLGTEAGGTDPLFPVLRFSLYPDEQPDLTLICYGGMAPLCMEAAHEVFMSDEILVEVLVPSLIKPLSLGSLKYGSDKVLVVEEGPVEGGWGAEVVAKLTENSTGISVARIGAPDLPIPAAMPLEAQVLPQVSDIIRAIGEMT